MGQWNNWDLEIFKFINSENANAFLDFLCPILRFPKTWIPLYISVLILGSIKYKRNVWLWIIFGILCITLTAQISGHCLNYLFIRRRQGIISKLHMPFYVWIDAQAMQVSHHLMRLIIWV